MTPDLSRHQRLAVLTVCSISVFMVQIDAMGVNMALPSLSRELHATTSQLQWVIDAYLLVLAALLIFTGSLGDRIGRRRVLMAGMSIFGLGSLLCSVSTSPQMLIAMRALQAVGGSSLAPVALSIVTNVFTAPRERAQAIGTWGAVVGVGMATGPLVGGALVDAIDWRSVFWVNVPIVAITVYLIHRLVPESRAGNPGRFDPWGQVLGILLLGSLTFAIIEGGDYGLTSKVVVAGALAVASGTAFVVVEHRVPEPLLDLRFFASLPFSLATGIALLAFFGFAGFLFVATLYLQDYLGLEPLHAGLVTLPMALANAALAPVSGWMVGRFGPRPPMVTGGVLMLVGAAMLTWLDAHTPLVWFVLAGVFVGMSLGTVNAPVTNTAVSGMPRSKAGVAGATASTARQLGQSLGVAVLGASLNSGLKSKLSFTDAAHPGWWVLIGVSICLVAMAVFSGTARAKASQRAVEAGFTRS